MNAEVVETPKQIIARIYSEHEDVADAANAVKDEARRNRDLYEYLLDPFLDRAAYEAVRYECRSDRKRVWTAPNYDQGGNGHRVEEHASRLLDFPLPGGLRLRHADATQVRQAAEFYATQAADMTAKSHWLTRVADAIGDETVGDVMDEQALEALK